MALAELLKPAQAERHPDGHPQCRPFRLTISASGHLL